MTRKLKIYLDTSIISHLDQPNKPSEYEYTHLFWRDIGNYDVYISEVVLYEMGKCQQEKLDKLTDFLAGVDYTLAEESDDVYRFADVIIKRGVLPLKSIADSRHIACAVFSECDYLLTWNMNHLANVDTNEGVRKLTFEANYKPLLIIPPSMLVKKEDTDNDET